jgi:hypothetical protein
MIENLFPLMTLSDHIWLLVWAMAGGILVFAGLVAEKVAEILNERFLGGGHPHKKLGDVGWVILMIGIAIEITDAGFAANEGWQTRQLAIKSNPAKRPISEISAFVYFKVKEAVPLENPNQGSTRVAIMMLCETNMFIGVLGYTNAFHFEGISQLTAMEADKFDRGFDGKTSEYYLQFHVEGIEPMFMRRSTKSVEWALENVRFLDIETKILPHDAEILSGSVVLTINSSFQKWFDIPAQRDLNPNSGKPGYGYQVIASVP